MSSRGFRVLFALSPGEEGAPGFRPARPPPPIPAALRERLDELAEPVRPLEVLDREVREQEEDRDDNWHVNVGDPVAPVQQMPPDASYCGDLQLACVRRGGRRIHAHALVLQGKRLRRLGVDQRAGWRGTFGRRYGVPGGVGR